MDMQEQIKKLEATIERNDEAWAAWSESVGRTIRDLVDAGWNGLMELPEEGRDRIDPDWRESYARWTAHRTGTEQP